MEKLLPDNHMSNVTFNDNILINTLNEIKKSSCSYISEIQADLVGYHRYDFKMSDFRLDRGAVEMFTTARRYSINVPKQLIPTSNKEIYKKSNVFMKELSIQEIAQEGKLFVYNFIVFIDGKAYTNLKIVIGEDLSRVVLYINNEKVKDGFDERLFASLVAENAPVTVFFIPNSIYADYSTNKFVVKKYKNNIPVDKFNFYGELGKKALTYSTFTGDKQRGYLFSERFSLEKGVVSVSENFEKHLPSTLVDIGVVSFNHYDRTIEIPVGGDYFELPIRQHIVPVSSFLPLYEEDGILKYYHGLDIQYHYPNIYKVTGNTVPVHLHVFYYEPTDNSHFVNEMELYYRFFGDTVLEKWKNGTIPDIIKNFKPKEYPVSIRDLLQSEYSQVPLHYKTSKMHEFIDRESRKLGCYLDNMLQARTKTRIYTKNVDLESKLRTGVSQEIPTNTTKFDEERYVFIFAKYFVNEYELRFFIDGMFYVCDHTYHDDQYYYFYIPKKIITGNTLIDIEKHRSVSYEHHMTFDKPIKEITIRDNPCIASDALFIDEKGNYLDEQYFKFVIKEDGKEISIDADSHKPLGDTFKVHCANPDLRNKPMSILFKRLSAVFELKVENEVMASKSILIGSDISRHPGHFRIYRNGRMLPPEVYDIRFKKQKKGYTAISLNRTKKVGDTYHIELNPNVFYTHYFTYEITDSGLLDFGGLINKPFDLKWFDVYLNGFKLSENNFDLLTPRYVLIKGVRTTDNLLIMEKNWRDDIFKFRVSDTDPIPPAFDVNNCTDDELLQNIKEFQDAIDKIKDQIIKDDSIDNILTDIVEDLSDEITKRMGDLFEYVFNVNKFINPDVMYSGYDIPEDIKKLIEDEGNIVKVFPKLIPNVTTPVVINPDGELIDPSQIDTSGGIIVH